MTAPPTPSWAAPSPPHLLQAGMATAVGGAPAGCQHRVGRHEELLGQEPVLVSC